jgi:5-carboxymethyl-2-hydroxymuconate isomerase
MTDKKDPLMEDRLGADRDDFYHLLMELHEGLSMEQSQRLNARLVLIMANQIGDIDVLKSVLNAAGEAGK